MLARVMRAIRVHEVGAPSVLKVEHNFPIPEPASNQVLLRVKAVGVNPVETYIRSGIFGRMPTLPYTPGNDAAGIVEKVGADVKKFKTGDRVFICGSPSGTYAEYATAPENRTFELPENVTFEQGAGLGVPYFTAYRALFHKGQLDANKTLLVRGASGAVGFACVQLARRLGVKQIVGTVGTEEGVKQLSDAALCGPGQVYNHRDEDYNAKLRSRFPKGFDCIVEVLANVNLAKDLELVADGGVVVIVGCRGLADGVDGRRFMASECTVTGVGLYHTSEAQYEESAREIVAGARAGSVLPIVAASYSLENAPEAHVHVIAESKTPGKIVIVP